MRTLHLIRLTTIVLLSGASLAASLHAEVPRLPTSIVAAAPDVGPLEPTLEATPDTLFATQPGADETVAATSNQIDSFDPWRRSWAQVDGLVWWIKGNRIPALVTTSPNGTARDDAGVLGVPGTRILFGNDRVDDNFRNGGRINLGYWLCEEGAIEFTYFGLGDGANSGNYYNRSTGDPILARPFFNVDAGVNGQDSELVAFPNVLDGQIWIRTNSEMHSASMLYRHVLRSGDRGRLSMMAGYRYMRFRESIHIQEDLIVTELGGLVAQGTNIVVNDRFNTENDFHGGEVGLSAIFFADRFSYDFLAKIAFGGIERQAQILGSTTTTSPPPGNIPATGTGGLLALPTNIGTYQQQDFAMLPELNVNMRYQWTDALSLQAGYSLLFLTSVFRTGDQIDTIVNGTQLPGGGGLVGDARPAPILNDTSLWAQGFNFGVTIEH